MVTLVVDRMVGSGVPLEADSPLARLDPKIATMLPGATAPLALRAGAKLAPLTMPLAYTAGGPRAAAKNTLRTRSFTRSPMSRFPEESSASDQGKFSIALVAA